MFGDKSLWMDCQNKLFSTENTLFSGNVRRRKSQDGDHAPLGLIAVRPIHLVPVPRETTFISTVEENNYNHIFHVCTYTYWRVYALHISVNRCSEYKVNEWKRRL